ncbi:hypothetical protein SAMD00019534_089420 [Acytostelium subglobosum LB1]|uniref:hypothetical protein n=1 Tax=Acytostelium subglobosum LB1 TaxID=1410327 RepID=UPI000644C4B2|nr:hypothetical protein SAMD00019534_089420 [Acytostelium subglobosum LB1]GAM25767.1 hypothetical protein SAMD00019534_089420 [Acytostelium subglobosum LB1]|eukprot:XP_012751285.1 hypothetical protein SAMD00019534_089420 [Acytostelium subglobosum LB1]
MNIETQVFFGSLNFSAPLPVSSTQLVVPLPLAARNGPLYLVSNGATSNNIYVNLTPYFNASPMLDIHGGNITITGYFLNYYRWDNIRTDIAAKYVSKNGFSNFEMSFIIPEVGKNHDNTQLVLTYPPGIGLLKGTFVIDSQPNSGVFVPNYNTTTLVSYAQLDPNDPWTVTMTIANYNQQLSNIQFWNYWNGVANLNMKWINDNTMTFSYIQPIPRYGNKQLECPVKMWFQPDGGNSNRPDFLVYPRSSITVYNGVPTTGGLLQVSDQSNNPKTACFTQLRACTVAGKLINGPFECSNIQIPAGVGLQVPINCTDVNGNPLLTEVIHFNYGPSVANGHISGGGSTLLVNGLGFALGDTWASFLQWTMGASHGQLDDHSIILYGTTNSTNDRHIQSLSSVVSSATAPIIGNVQLTIKGAFLNVQPSNFGSTVKVGSEWCTIISNDDGVIVCWTRTPQSSGPLPLVITIDSTTNDPFNVQFDLFQPSITSITPTYNENFTQLNVQGTGLGQSILINSNNQAYLPGMCNTINDSLIICDIKYPNGTAAQGSMSVVRMGIVSIPLAFDFVPVISNQTLTGSTLVILGTNISPFAYMTRQTSSSQFTFQPTSATSTKIIFQLPAQFQSGPYQIFSSGFLSSELVLSLQPVITNIGLDTGGLFISGQYLDVMMFDRQLLQYSLNVNSRPVASIDTVVSYTNKLYFALDEPIVPLPNGSSPIVQVDLTILKLSSTYQASIILPQVDNVTFIPNIDTSSSTLSRGTIIFTGTNLDCVPNLIIGPENGPYPIKNSSPTNASFALFTLTETIYTFVLTTYPTAVWSNNVSIHILKPTLDSVTINEHSFATIKGSYLLSQLMRFGTYQPTNCAGGGFNSNMTTCDLSQCGDCLATCNTFTYDNEMTSFSQVYYHVDPILIAAVANGTQVIVNAALSCTQSTIRNLLELVSINIGNTQCVPISMLDNNVYSCQSTLTSGSVSVSLLGRSSNSLPLVYIDPSSNSSSSHDNSSSSHDNSTSSSSSHPKPSSSSKLPLNHILTVIIILISLVLFT